MPCNCPVCVRVGERRYSVCMGEVQAVGGVTYLTVIGTKWPVFDAQLWTLPQTVAFIGECPVQKAVAALKCDLQTASLKFVGWRYKAGAQVFLLFEREQATQDSAGDLPPVGRLCYDWVPLADIPPYDVNPRPVRGTYTSPAANGEAARQKTAYFSYQLRSFADLVRSADMIHLEEPINY